MFVASDGLFLRVNYAVSPKRKLFEEISEISETADIANATKPGSFVAISVNKILD
jgi:hypothetical protein